MAAFGEYEIISKLGQGGMGAVYKARHTASGRIVALKVISSATVLSEKSRARFLTEARSMARFRHSNIVALYEVSEVNHTPYLAMEFIEGRLLSDVATERIPGAHQAAAWMLSITNAIAHAHAAGIIHRDLKPGNVMINLRGEAVVMDFGIAKDVGADMGMTATGQIIGTPAFMSPEQGEGKPVDCRSDVFSLGGILYMLLTGLPPFIGPSSAAIMLKVVQEDPVPPSKITPTADKTLEAICLKALRKDPAERYQSADAMCADLSAFLVGGGVAAKSEHFKAQPKRIQRSRQGKPLTSALVFATFGVAALAALVWVTWRIRSNFASEPVSVAGGAGYTPTAPAPANSDPAAIIAPSPAPSSTIPAAATTSPVKPPDAVPGRLDEGDRRLRQCQFEEAIAFYDAAGADAARKTLARNALALREAAAQSLAAGGRTPVTLHSGERATACSVSRGSVVLADTQGSVTSKTWQDLGPEDAYRIFRAALKQPTTEQCLVLGSLCQAMGLNANATALFDDAVRADPSRKADVDRLLSRPTVGGP